jgi:hypothetical protein
MLLMHEFVVELVVNVFWNDIGKSCRHNLSSTVCGNGVIGHHQCSRAGVTFGKVTARNEVPERCN